MTKQEMLSEVIIMRNLWQKAIELKSVLFINNNHLNTRFCKYFANIFPSNGNILHQNRIDLQNELRKDLLKKTNHFSYYYYVYDFITSYYIDDIIKNQLQPRLDHLNRTIARLEKEIAIENINTPIQKPTQL